MKTRLNTLTYVLIMVVASLMTSCYTEDPGPVQEEEKEFTEVNFDRLEMGDAFNITVKQGNLFQISARGDSRNIDDLKVTKEGSTLVIKYRNNRSRTHDTYITITMPTLLSTTFSGATDSRVEGFDDLETLSIYLSGASVLQLDGNVKHVNAVLSGASYLYLSGEGENINANISGASGLKAFHFPVTTAKIQASGASDGKIMVSDQLEAMATGASVIIYRGKPVVTSEVSGASTVRED